MRILSFLTLLLCASPAMATFQRYHKGDTLPKEIVSLAHCKKSDGITFGTEVNVWNSNGRWHIRPAETRRPDVNEYLLVIGPGAEGCHFSGDFLDVRWPGEGEITVEYE